MALSYDKAAQIWVNSWSDNGLLHEGTRPLSDPMLTYHQEYFFGIHMRAIS